MPGVVSQRVGGHTLVAAGKVRDLARVLYGVAGVVAVGEQFERLGFALRHRGERLVDILQPQPVLADAPARRLQPDQ